MLFYLHKTQQEGKSTEKDFTDHIHKRISLHFHSLVFLANYDNLFKFFTFIFTFKIILVNFWKKSTIWKLSVLSVNIFVYFNSIFLHIDIKHNENMKE